MLPQQLLCDLASLLQNSNNLVLKHISWSQLAKKLVQIFIQAITHNSGNFQTIKGLL